MPQLKLGDFSKNHQSGTLEAHRVPSRDDSDASLGGDPLDEVLLYEESDIAGFELEIIETVQTR